MKKPITTPTYKLRLTSLEHAKSLCLNPDYLDPLIFDCC